jgi:hypothetical protein
LHPGVEHLLRPLLEDADDPTGGVEPGRRPRVRLLHRAPTSLDVRADDTTWRGRP